MPVARLPKLLCKQTAETKVNTTQAGCVLDQKRGKADIVQDLNEA